MKKEKELRQFENLEAVKKAIVKNGGEFNVSYGFNSNTLHYYPEIEGLGSWSVFWSVDGELEDFTDETIIPVLQEMLLLEGVAIAKEVANVVEAKDEDEDEDEEENEDYLYKIIDRVIPEVNSLYKQVFQDMKDEFDCSEEEFLEKWNSIFNIGWDKVSLKQANENGKSVYTNEYGMEEGYVGLMKDEPMDDEDDDRTEYEAYADSLYVCKRED